MRRLVVGTKHQGQLADARTRLTVRNLTMRGVGELWGGTWPVKPPKGVHGWPQGFFPITLSAANPLHNRVQLDGVTIIDKNTGSAGSARCRGDGDGRRRSADIFEVSWIRSRGDNDGEAEA